MELILNLVSVHSSIHLKFKIMETCKSCQCEFMPSKFTNPCNYRKIKNAFRAFKKLKKKKIQIFYRRKLHTENEPILLFIS